MNLIPKLKTKSRAELASIGFYLVTGIILFAVLVLTGFPPHLALIAITSLITAYGLFTKRFWAIWLVAILFIVISTFALYTLISVGFSNPLTVMSLTVYTVMTWIFTVYIVFKRKPSEP